MYPAPSDDEIIKLITDETICYRFSEFLVKILYVLKAAEQLLFPKLP